MAGGMWRVSGLGRLAAAAVIVLGMISSPGHADDCGIQGTDKQGNCRDEPLVTLPTGGPTGTEFLSEPPGVEVTEDGVVLGLTPIRLGPGKLKPGRHLLTFYRENFERIVNRPVVVKAGELQRMSVKMVPLPSINIVGDAQSKDAVVTIDSRHVGTVPVSNLFLAVGQHLVKVEKPGFDTWIQEITLESGAPLRTLKPVLKEQFGTLAVGGGVNDLTGVRVWLDPDSLGESKANTSRVKGGTLLGTTPTTGRSVPSGKHVLAFEIEGLLPITEFVSVPVDSMIRAPVEIDFEDTSKQYEADWSNRDKVNVRKARRECHHRNGSACIVAGHAAMRVSPPDLKQALADYKAGCDLKNGESCFSLGYLEKKGHLASAGEHLKSACDLGAINACLARHQDIARVPDPTKNAGPWTDYTPQEKPHSGSEENDPASKDPYVGLNGIIAVGPFDGVPLQLEGIGFMGGPTHYLLAFRFGLGLRLRLVHQLDVSSMDRHYEVDGGVGIEWGIRFRFGKDSRFAVDDTLRFTAMYAAQSSLSNLTTIGWTGRHGLQIGVLVDKMPLLAQQVDAFGGKTSVERYTWEALLVASYSFARILR